MKPVKIKLAVEKLNGPENRIAEVFISALSKHRGLSLFGPDALARLRREIENSRTNIGVHRAAQIAIRDTLWMDYVINFPISIRSISAGKTSETWVYGKTRCEYLWEN